MAPKIMEKGSNHKSFWICVSIVILVAACVGVIYALYYDRFQVLTVEPSKNSYMAAVVDYTGYYEENFKWPLLVNVDHYENIIRQAAKYMIDIIVFPEEGLWVCGAIGRDEVLKSAVFVPSVEDSAVPCDGHVAHDDVIGRLSCAAKAANMYVAVNVWEKFYEKRNTTIETLLYNTAVVFDRRGMVVARYRKYNLFMERWMYGANHTQTPELVTFKTDFGETFGIIICFDIYFKEPAVTLVEEKKVTSMIYLSAPFSVLPFLTTTSVEAGWSYAMDVNVLASCLPSNYSFRASNIYFGKNEQLNTYMTDYGYAKIIMGAIPKNGAKYLQNGIIEPKLPKYSVYGPRESIFVTESTLNLSQSRSLFDSKLNNDSNMGLERNEFHYSGTEFDCIVSVVWRNGNVTVKPNYQMLAYSGEGNLTLASVNDYVEMCGLILCSNKQNQYCEVPPKFEDSNKITVVSVNIVATSRKNTALTIPVAFDSELLPFDASLVSFNSFLTRVGDQEIKVMEMNLKQPRSDLVTFGMYTLPEECTPIQITNPSLEWLKGLKL